MKGGSGGRFISRTSFGSCAKMLDFRLSEYHRFAANLTRNDCKASVVVFSDCGTKFRMRAGRFLAYFHFPLQLLKPAQLGVAERYGRGRSETGLSLCVDKQQQERHVALMGPVWFGAASLPDCFAAWRVSGDRWALISVEIEDDCFPVLRRWRLALTPASRLLRRSRTVSVTRGR